jgi:hypothetical protein
VKAPAIWVELYLVRRATLYGCRSSLGGQLEQVEQGVVGPGVTHHGMRASSKLDDNADDALVWQSLGETAQRILELLHSPKAHVVGPSHVVYAELEESTRLVTAGELVTTEVPVQRETGPCGAFTAGRGRCRLARRPGSSRCHVHEQHSPKALQTRDGDELVEFEQHGETTMARVRRRRVPTFTLEDIGEQLDLTVPAVRWAIRKAYATITDRLVERAAAA